MSADDFSRFQRTVRSRVRQHVAKEKEPPPLTLWASEAGNPRRVLALRVGAARDASEIRSNIVEAIRERGAHFAAIGRGGHVDEGDGPEATPVFYCVFVSETVITTMQAEIVAGDMGAWRPAGEVATQLGESTGDAWFFVQQAIRGARQRVVPESGAVLLDAPEGDDA